MKESGKSLRRVAAVYGMVERLRLVELQRSSAALEEAVGFEAAACAAAAAGALDGREALGRGDIAEWRAAERTREQALDAREAALSLQAEREPLERAAADAHRQSRMRTEQVLRVVERRTRVEAELEARREQAAADDRYGARLRMKPR